MISLTGSLSLANNLLSLCDRVKSWFQPKYENISLNYIRVFGLHGISRIWLRLNEKNGTQIDSFVSSWEYGRAGIVMSEPLDWLRNQSIPKVILESHPQTFLSQYGQHCSIQWISKRGGHFLVNSDIEISADDIYQLHDPDCQRGDDCFCFVAGPILHQCIVFRDENLGALAVAIENRTDRDLLDVKLNYLLIALDGPSEPIQKCKIIPLLAQGQAMIWPLRIYSADTKGFEVRILSPNLIPTSITYVIDGSEKLLPVRPPLREKAARIVIPGGWYHQ